MCLQHERAAQYLRGFPAAGLNAASPDAAGESADAALANTAAGIELAHDADSDEDHLSDYPPSLAQGEEVMG